VDDLKRKAYPLILRGGWTAVSYLLFSRVGFTPALEARAQDEGVLVLRPEDLLASPL
jgi:hypothetical protein